LPFAALRIKAATPPAIISKKMMIAEELSAE
jgi:hypothetical protein